MCFRNVIHYSTQKPLESGVGVTGLKPHNSVVPGWETY